MRMLTQMIGHIAERAFALLALSIVWPVMVISALLIKLSSPGPIFFIQERILPDGTTHELLKFRTMRIDCETSESPQPNWVRVTSVGKVLRKYSLDELPKLLSVLAGRTSLFGLLSHPSPVYTRVILHLMRKRVCLAAGFLVVAGVYTWTRSKPDYLVITLCLLFGGGLFFDLLLASYRYSFRIYGDSALELAELRDYLMSKRVKSGGGGIGGTQDFYPEEEEEAETIIDRPPVLG